MRYVRKGWRDVEAGDVLKDPRGNRVVHYADKWGYSLEPGPEYPYGPFMRNWPKVGRLKVVCPTKEARNEE